MNTKKSIKESPPNVAIQLNCPNPIVRRGDTLKYYVDRQNLDVGYYRTYPAHRVLRTIIASQIFGLALSDCPIKGIEIPILIGAGNWNNIEARVYADLIEVYVNGVFEFSYNDSTWTGGKVGLLAQGTGIYEQEYEFDNVLVTI